MTTLTPTTGNNITPPFMFEPPSAKISLNSSRAGSLIAQGTPIQIVITSSVPGMSLKEFSIFVQVTTNLDSTTRESTEKITFTGISQNTVSRFDINQGSVITKASFVYDKNAYNIPLHGVGQVSQILCSFLPNNDVCLKVVSKNSEMSSFGFKKSFDINYFSLKKPSNRVSTCELHRGNSSRRTTELYVDES